MSYERRYKPIGRNGDFSIGDLEDVTVTGVADGDMLIYNATSGKWENGDGTLANLGDTTITAPATGQVLYYDGAAWVNHTDFALALSSPADGDLLQYNNGSGTWVNATVASIIGTAVTDVGYPAALGHAGI